MRWSAPKSKAVNSSRAKRMRRRKKRPKPSQIVIVKERHRSQPIRIRSDNMVYLLILVAFALDRLSKWWAAAYLTQHGPLQLHDYIILRLTVNRGMVFGLAQGVGPLMGWLSLLII